MARFVAVKDPEILVRAAAALSDAVELTGWIQDMRPLVASADIGVQTSRTEGLSMALLEQMMAGLTVVATDVGETRPVLDDGRCGPCQGRGGGRVCEWA